MILNKENYIDLYNREYVVFHANQFDNETRTITLIPKNESELVSLKNYTPRLLYYKPDGHACFYDLSYNEDDSITILLTEQMLSVSGDCLGQLYLTEPSTGEVITSTTFVIKVAKRNDAGEIIESCDDFDALNQMVTRVENVVEKSDTIDEMLTTSEDILKKTQTAYDNAVNAVNTAESINSTAEESARLAKESELNAADSKKEANRHALMSESYFHGGTGIRDGEDEENVLSFYEKIQSIADTSIATEAKAGLVKAGEDVHVTTDGTMNVPKLLELENLIKGASSAKVCEDLEDMVAQLNTASLADFTVGTNILIKAVGVPDFWISEVYTENTPYVWTNDEDFINNLHPASSPSDNSLQVGYYGISFLETDKVDLTGIAKKSYVDQKFTEAQTYSDINLATAKNYTDNKISGIANTQTPTFLEAETRENIVSGEKLSTIFGKIKKWFSDFKTVAFTGSYNDLTNKPVIPTIPSSLPADGGNADTVDGFHASQTRNAKNTCVVRDDSGFTHLNYINSDTGRNENGVVSQIITTNDTDNYYRKVSLEHLKSKLNVTKGDVGLGNVTNTEQMPLSYWHWSEQGGQPTWLWGGNNGNNYYVYNPANFNVNRANALTYHAYGSFAEITVESLSKAASVYYSGSDPNAPETDSNIYWWNVFQFGEANRLTQIASGAYHHMKRGLYARTKHDGNWSNWFYLPTQNEIANTNVKQHTIQFAQGGAGTFTSEIPLLDKGFTQPPVVNFRGTNGNAGYYFDILDCSVNRVLVRVERRFGSGNDSDAFIAYMIGI